MHRRSLYYPGILAIHLPMRTQRCPSLAIQQQEMAEALGTSVDTIKSWESRRRNPTGLAAKVLATIADNPSLFRELGRIRN